MRTMLILALLCSLAHLVESGGAAPEGCGTTYDCFAPEMCINKNRASVVNGKNLVALTDDNIEEPCPAIIKFHQYAKYWVYVSMESFEASTDSIEFYTTESNGNRKVKFACVNQAGKALATFERLTDPEVTISSNAILPSTLLKCDFDLKLKISDDFFKTDIADKLYMKIGAESTLRLTYPLTTLLKCDPSDLKFEQNIEPTKVLAKVKHAAGKYSCDKGYKMEFRPDTSPNYREQSSTVALTCEDQRFHVDGVKQEDYWINIRCAAPAKFFCDYDAVPKPDLVANTEQKLDFVGPVGFTTEGSLKCPAGFPHLFIEKLPPITNPTFECRNYGGQQYWSVVGSHAYLTDKEPKAHCSKTVDCNLLHKIPSKSIPNGFVNDKFLPECFENGVLHVDDAEVTVWCDISDGNFKYNIAGQDPKPVMPDTNFGCTYAIVENEQENKRNEKAVKDGLFIVIGSVVGGLAVIVIGAVVLTKCAVMRAKKRAKRIQEQGNINFFMNDQEKEIARKKLPSKEKQQTTEPLSWNKFLMNLQYTNQSHQAEGPSDATQTATKPSPTNKDGKEVQPKYVTMNKRTIGIKKLTQWKNAIDSEMSLRFDGDFVTNKAKDDKKQKKRVDENRKNATKPAPK